MTKLIESIARFIITNNIELVILLGLLFVISALVLFGITSDVKSAKYVTKKNRYRVSAMRGK